MAVLRGELSGVKVSKPEALNSLRVRRDLWRSRSSGRKAF